MRDGKEAKPGRVMPFELNLKPSFMADLLALPNKKTARMVQQKVEELRHNPLPDGHLKEAQGPRLTRLPPAMRRLPPLLHSRQKLDSSAGSPSATP